ncbi:hypothetical protein [Vibrio sp. D431a]|uniref:hypothetical protein n=1 Tax=Vibrio sp. D431a TaxID=2837388 RepID=UPI0025533A23|nr:hypothetical protein [Vibrio sp. D431a]MDK9789897.1 hypothetical protein [Vibrio sp. D431a]
MDNDTNLNDVLDLTPSQDIVEPNDYFEALKAKVESNEDSRLKEQYKMLISEIEGAAKIGQDSLIEHLLFNIKVITKEIALIDSPFNKFVRKEALKEMVDKVQPKDSIKIIELERFPRLIPNEVKEKIAAAKDLGIFDKYCVVFTDLTQNDYKTPKEREFVDRNRDPIVFGYFSCDSLKQNHEKFFLIGDWVDEWCDLTFTKAVEKMSSMGIQDNHGELKDLDTIMREYSIGAAKDIEKENNAVNDKTGGFFHRVAKKFAFK